MSCIAPIEVLDKPLQKRGLKGATLKVPCGHCVECARDRRNDWFVRLWSMYRRMEELGVPVWYVTVTIDPKLWPDMRLDSPGIGDRITPFVRSWNERVRYLCGGAMPIRFLCSEFGSKDRDYVDKHGVLRVTTGALHFHGLLFGRLPLDRLLPGLAETHGHMDIDRIRGRAAIRYIVKYSTKDYSIADPKLRARTFCSPGIGDPTYYFGDSPASRIVLINGYHYRTPRYLIEKQWYILYAKRNFSVVNKETLRAARLASFDCFGRSVFVRENAKRRADAYSEAVRSNCQRAVYDPAGYRANIDLCLSRPSRILSFEQLCSLRDLRRIGPGHPELRRLSNVRLDERVCSALMRDVSFVSYSPIFYKPIKNYFNERNQIILSLPLDFPT